MKASVLSDVLRLGRLVAECAGLAGEGKAL